MTNEQIASDLSAIKTTLERMDKEMFGNGQPGRFQKIEIRLSDVEDFEAKAKGAGVVVGGLFTTLGAVLWRHLAGK